MYVHIWMFILCLRSRILDDRSLQISRVKVSDEGNYVCTARNGVGSVEAVARLTVHSK